MSGKNRRGKSAKPRKDGMPDGWPTFKSKFGGKDGFARTALNFDTPKSKSIIESSRRIYIHSFGSFRVGGSTKVLRDYVNNGGIIKTARFTKRGGFWYLSLSVSVPVESIKVPTESEVNRLKNNGDVGIDLGVKRLATLSNGEYVDNPRTGQVTKKRTDNLRRALSSKAKGSESRKVVARKLSKHLHRVDLSKKTMLHTLTKDWSTKYIRIALEDLNVSGMTSSVAPKPDPEHEGKFLPNGKAAKSGLNREILDIGFYELRRQLEYKSLMYGSHITIIDRFFPSSKLCSSCGSLDKELTLSVRLYECGCGLSIDRDLNAAINIRNYSTS